MHGFNSNAAERLDLMIEADKCLRCYTSDTYCMPFPSTAESEGPPQGLLTVPRGLRRMLRPGARDPLACISRQCASSSRLIAAMGASS